MRRERALNLPYRSNNANPSSRNAHITATDWWSRAKTRASRKRIRPQESVGLSSLSIIVEEMGTREKEIQLDEAI
jgi:hypothetical protein